MSMKGHKIYARHSDVREAHKLFLPLIKRCVWVVLEVEKVDIPCEVSVLITSNWHIRELNNKFLGIDKPTDVLSFPMHNLIPGQLQLEPHSVDPATGLLPLGEIVLSAEQVDRQARKLRHSRERETAYLTVHAMLHLLGYDHYGDELEIRSMREREKLVMMELGFHDDL